MYAQTMYIYGHKRKKEPKKENTYIHTYTYTNTLQTIRTTQIHPHNLFKTYNYINIIVVEKTPY